MGNQTGDCPCKNIKHRFENNKFKIICILSLNRTEICDPFLESPGNLPDPIRHLSGPVSYRDFPKLMYPKYGFSVMGCIET